MSTNLFIAMPDAVKVATSAYNNIMERRAFLQKEWKTTLNKHLVRKFNWYGRCISERPMTDMEKHKQDKYARDGSVNYYGDTSYSFHDEPVTEWYLVADFTGEYNQCYHVGRRALQLAETILDSQNDAQFVDMDIDDWRGLKAWYSPS